MLTFKTKIALGIGSLGTIGGGGVALNSHLTSGTTIKDYLRQKGFTLVENDNLTWKAILRNYEIGIKTKPELSFEDFKGETGKEGELKNYCDKLLNKKHKRPEEIKDYKKWVWCIKEQTVSEYLKVEGHITYKTDNNSDDSNWNKKIIEHSKDLTNKAKIKQLKLSGQNLSIGTDQDKTNIKKSCKDLNGKKHYEESFEESKSLSTAWCSS